MDRREPGLAQDRWIEHHAPKIVYLYSAFIIVLMPAFHFVLSAAPGHPRDSLAIRFVAAGISLTVASLLYLVPPLRRYAEWAQFASLLPTMIIVLILVIDSGNNSSYVASGLLMVVGAQHAFFKPLRLAVAMIAALVFQAAYSAYHGILFEPQNLIALAIYGAAYVLAFVPASIRMGVQRRELFSRLAAERLTRKVEARERALRESQERLAQVHAMTHLGNWARDLQTGEEQCSPELLRMLDLHVDVAPQGLRDLYERFIYPSDAKIVSEAMLRARANALPFDIDHRLQLLGGRVMWVHLYGQYEYDENGHPKKIVAAVLDITRRKEAEESLKALAATDLLTGLANRATLQQRLQQAIRAADIRGTQGAVFFLDLDNFKDINDTLGHSVGDVLLRAVATRLASAIPENGFVARWGGDEFVVVVNELSAQPLDLAHELVRLFTRPFTVEEYEFVINASVGVSIFPDDALESAILIRNADTAMYKAKERRGLGYAIFEPAMHDEARSRHEVQNDLRRALATDGFVLHYQPVVRTADGRMIGAEALLRLRGTGDNLRQPSEFIDVAEETGLIVPIGAWVLREACRQLAAWKSAGLDLRVSVNVSARHFMHPSFLDHVFRALDEAGVEPDMLDIEITETALMSEVQAVLGVLQTLRAKGVTITVDDFGTGYSSLAYLRQFPLDALKLDYTFVSAVNDSQQRVIARSILRIAHTLGMRVTAEGVETAGQYAAFDAMRCDRVQGFYVARPMPAYELTQLYESAGDESLVARSAADASRRSNILRLR